MILQDIHELALIGVMDKNVPNQERIIIRPTQLVNLGAFGLLLGKRMPNNMVNPLPDHFLWFGELMVAPPSWIFIYTGPGAFRQSKMPVTGEDAYVFHWGKKFTILGQAEVTPFLFRFDGVLIPPGT